MTDGFFYATVATAFVWDLILMFFFKKGRPTDAD
jgi:hypothetical protein